jgi:hypothetical protein
MIILACVSRKLWCGLNHSSLNCYTPLKVLQGNGVRTFRRIGCRIVIVNPPPSTWGLVLYICWDIHPSRGCQLSAYRDVCAARTRRQNNLSRTTFGYHRTHQNYADGDFRRLAYVPTLPIWTLAVGIGTRTQEARVSTIGIGTDRQRCEMIARGGAFVRKSRRYTRNSAKRAKREDGGRAPTRVPDRTLSQNP